MLKIGLLNLLCILVYAVSNYRVADAIYCYACNSNWEACGIEPKLEMLKYNKEPCTGPCKIWKEGNIVHRACTYDTAEKISPRIGTKYCGTDLCNHKFLDQERTTTSVPLVTNKTTTKITPRPVATAPPRTSSSTTLAPQTTSKTTIRLTPPPVPTAPPRTSSTSTSAPVTTSKTTIKITPRPVPTVAPRTSPSTLSPVSSSKTTIRITPAPIPTVPPRSTSSSSSAPLTTKPLIPTAPPRVTTPSNIGSGNLITYDEFKNAVTRAGYPTPSLVKYTNYVNQLGPRGGITTKREAAMFLSQILWESDGLVATSEYACAQTGCPGVYGSSQYPGQSYYGRGYIQLSWNYNYDAASRALYGDDRLLRDPNQVATNDEIAWATAFWFWKSNVGSRADVKNGCFGSSTMAINGGLECNGPYQDKARKRFEIYKIVMQEYHLTETPIERGCYN